MTAPFLLQDLTAEQRQRVLALDYVITSGLVQPDGWLKMAEEIRVWLETGKSECRGGGALNIVSIPSPPERKET